MRSVIAIEQIEVQLDGVALDQADCRSLGSIYVRQRLSLPTQCELVFFDPAGSLAQAKGPRPGVELKISVIGHAHVLFEGQLTAVEYEYGPDYGRKIYLRAYDRLHRLRKRQNIRNFEQITLDQLVSQLVSEDGLDVQIGSLEYTWPWLIQHRHSDFELLCEAAQRSGGYFYLHAKMLGFFTLDGSGEPIKLSLGSTLLEAGVEINAEKACDVVDAAGWDPVWVGSSSAASKEPHRGRRIGVEIDPRKSGGSGTYHLLDESASSDDQAHALAQAELDRRVAASVVLRAVAQGDTRLNPGARVKVQGMTENLDGQYVLTDVTHTIDRERGYLSRIDTNPPPIRRVSRETIAALGVVTSVDDPEKKGRVRARMPTFQDVQTDWMRVVTPGGGNQKGLVMLPAVDDHVLILFTHADPAHGVVMGGLFQEQGAYDAGVDGEQVVRYSWKTSEDQIIFLDDAEGKLKMQNQDGSYLQMSPDNVELHAQRDLIIEAPGRKIKIRGAAIDFERA